MSNTKEEKGKRMKAIMEGARKIREINPKLKWTECVKQSSEQLHGKKKEL